MRFLYNTMQPFTLRLIIAGPLFALITAASLIWWVAQMPANPQIPAARASIEVPPSKTSFDPKVYSVSFCELVKNPVSYDRKLIRMQAVFVNDVDWAYLASDACPDENGVVQAVDAIEPDDKLIESKSRDQIGPLLDKLIREGRPLEVKVEMLGRFYASSRDGRGHQFAIIANSNARPTGRRMRR
jgi:hypothetical protein